MAYVYNEKILQLKMEDSHDFGFNKPRVSENVSVKNWYLYRGTRLRYINEKYCRNTNGSPAILGK